MRTGIWVWALLPLAFGCCATAPATPGATRVLFVHWEEHFEYPGASVHVSREPNLGELNTLVCQLEQTSCFEFQAGNWEWDRWAKTIEVSGSPPDPSFEERRSRLRPTGYSARVAGMSPAFRLVHSVSVSGERPVRRSGHRTIEYRTAAARDVSATILGEQHETVDVVEISLEVSSQGLESWHTWVGVWSEEGELLGRFASRFMAVE